VQIQISFNEYQTHFNTLDGFIHNFLSPLQQNMQCNKDGIANHSF